MCDSALGLKMGRQAQSEPMTTARGAKGREGYDSRRHSRSLQSLSEGPGMGKVGSGAEGAGRDLGSFSSQEGWTQ